MKQRLISAFLALLFLVTLPLPALAWEDGESSLTSGACGTGAEWQLEGGVLTISGWGHMDDYRPSNAPWYDYREEITAIHIEDGIEYIGSNSFVQENNVTEILLPESLRNIGTEAFPQCGSTSQPLHLTIPGSVTGLGIGALSGCLMGSVTLPDTMTEIGDEAFQDCYFLEHIQIPIGVSTIGDSAFQNCVSLTRVDISANVTRMGHNVFQGCNSLKDIYFQGKRSQWEMLSPELALGNCPAVVHCQEEDVRPRFSLYFNANGGILQGADTSVTNGDPYGTLPTATLSGYDFAGWYTDPVSGTRITADTIVNLTEDQTLYAHWTPAAQRAGLETVTFRFANSVSGFGYPAGYSISQGRARQVFGATAFAETCAYLTSPWGSNCFGMASTAGLLSQSGNGIDPVNFRTTAQVPADLSPADGERGQELGMCIEAMQLCQYDYGIQQTIRANQGALDRIAAAAYAYGSTGKNPPLLLLYGPKGGHAVLGYDLLPDGDNQSRLLVYDPNYPNAQREIILYKDTSGTYTDWYYGLDTIWDWRGRDGATLSYLNYNDCLNLWNRRQGSGRMDLLAIESRNAVIWDSSGASIATIQDGQVLTTRTDIYPLLYAGLPANSIAPERTAVWLPAGETYTVRNTDVRTKTLTATLVHENLSVSTSTQADKVSFVVDDSKGFCAVELPGGGKDSYTLTLRNTHGVGPETTEITGTTTSDEAVLAYFIGNVYADGLDSRATIIQDGQTIQPSALAGGVEEMNAALSGKPVQPPAPTETKLPFQDVAAGDWYYNAVAYVYEKGLMEGTSPTAFTPNGTTTRGQLVTMLWRMAGSPASGENPFTDVNTGDWYAPAVAWANAAGVVNGKGSGRFAPKDPITRQDFAAILYRYAVYMGYAPTGSVSLERFTDAGRISGYAQMPMQWAVAIGLMDGVGNDQLAPQGKANRAQAAALLMRFTEKVQPS